MVVCVLSFVFFGAAVASAATLIDLSAMDSYYWSIPDGINSSDAVVGQGETTATMHSLHRRDGGHNERPQ